MNQGSTIFSQIIFLPKRLLFAEPNPAPLKAWLEQDGWCAADV